MTGEAVSIKGTREGLVILIDTSMAYEEIKKNLLTKMESSKGFFKGAKFAVYEHQSAAAGNYVELEDICRRYGLVPSPDICWPPVVKSKFISKTIENPRNSGESPVVLPLRRRVSLPSEIPGEKALLVNKTLRSGQKVANSESIVILGDVHAGSEVIAGGSVLISGHCRGTVHAGMNGATGAIVLAMSFNPVVLRIGNVLADNSQFDENIKGPLVACQHRDRIAVKKHR